MEISTHSLNLTPLLSLTGLPDVLCSCEKEQSTFRGWVVLLPFFPSLEGAAEKFFLTTEESFVSKTHIWKLRVLYSSLSQVSFLLSVRVMPRSEITFETAV